MVLNHQGAFAMSFIGAAHFTIDPGIVVDEVAVVVNRQPHGLGKRAVFLEDGCLVQNIIGLPVARCPAGIDQWWVLTIDRPTGTIRKGIVLKTV